MSLHNLNANEYERFHKQIAQELYALHLEYADKRRELGQRFAEARGASGRWEDVPANDYRHLGWLQARCLDLSQEIDRYESVVDSLSRVWARVLTSPHKVELRLDGDLVVFSRPSEKEEV